MPSSWNGLTHDILKQVYIFCGNKDLSNCAQTCKNWTDPALDHIWYEVRAKNMVHLFGALAPSQPAQTQTSTTLTRMVRSLSQKYIGWLLILV